MHSAKCKIKYRCHFLVFKIAHGIKDRMAAKEQRLKGSLREGG